MSSDKALPEEDLGVYYEHIAGSTCSRTVFRYNHSAFAGKYFIIILKTIAVLVRFIISQCLLRFLRNIITFWISEKW